MFLSLAREAALTNSPPRIFSRPEREKFRGFAENYGLFQLLFSKKPINTVKAGWHTACDSFFAEYIFGKSKNDLGDFAGGFAAELILLGAKRLENIKNIRRAFA